MSERPSNQDLVKRMQEDTCYTCKQKGHWSWYCPSKSPDNKPLLPSPSTPQSTHFTSNQDLVKRMQGDTCYACKQKGHWSWYCPSKSSTNKPLSPSFSDKKYYACPFKRGATCKDFVKRCDDPTYESDLQPPPFKYPECECGAGVCRRVKGTTENPHAVKYYFVCPVKKGHGSCGYLVSEDELLNNKSIVTDVGNDLGEGGDLLVQIKRMRIKDNSNNTSSVAVSEISGEEAGGSAIKAINPKHVGFPRFEVADDDLESTNIVLGEAIKEGAFLLSSLSAHSRIRHQQSVFQRLISSDASLASCSMGWLGHLLFFRPTHSLKFPPPQPFFCCIFPSFNPIDVPKQASIPNGRCEAKDLASNSLSQHTKLSTGCHPEVSREVVSPNKPPGNENKPISKAQRHREVALFTQQRLLIDLETLDPREHESMREAAETTFAVLNLLGVNFKQFSDHVMYFINLASSIAEMDKSMENSLTLEGLFEEEKVRLAHIQDDYVKTEALLKVSNEHRQSLFKQVSHLKATLNEMQNQLKSRELETLKIETHLGDTKQRMLEVNETVKDRAEQAEIALKQREEKQTKQIAAKRTLEKAKLEIEN